MKKMQTLLAAATILVGFELGAATSTSFTGYFYYVDRSFYKSVHSTQGSNSFYTPVRPSSDSGAPLSEYGWSWLGWGWEVNSSSSGGYHHRIATGYDYVSSGTSGNVTHYFYSTYSRTNYYHYYNSEMSTSVTTKKWEQQYSAASASSVTLPALMTQTTYNWIPKGWTATDKGYSSESDILYSSIEAKTVYPPANTNQNIRAVYNRAKTISFNANGASNGSVADKTFTQWFVAGKGATGTITLPENGFTRTGYTFNGWNTSSTATSGTTAGTTVTPDGAWTSVDTQTYYATWMANKYTISYDANGGIGEMEDTSTEYDMTVTITNNCFTRLAYVFKGWATESNGDVVYVPGQTVKNLTIEDGVKVILYAVWEPLVVPLVDSSEADGTTFCGDSYTVTLSCPLDGVAIYYSTNGVTPRTSATFAYTEPFTIYGSVDIVAVAVKDGVKSGYTRVSITQITPDAPVISPVDGTEFRSETCEVTISCATDGAEIYYTVDGSTPQKNNGTRYTAPFTIANTTTIKAVAIGGPLKSEVVTATIAKRSLSLAEATGATELKFDTDENVPWIPVVYADADNGFAAQSGTIGLDSATWMETTVSGKGTFSFRWRVECEEDDSGQATWDRFMVFTNGVEVTRIDGITEWERVSFMFNDIGQHTIRWVFLKDDYDEEGIELADHGWVSGVVWAPYDPLPALDAAATDNDAQAIIGGLLDARLSDKICSTAAYTAFRNWVDDKGLAHALVKDAQNAWLSYALDASGLMAKPEPLESEDVMIESIMPSSTANNTFDLTVSIGGTEIGEGACLAEALGVEGAAELNESAFSADGLTVRFDRTADGKARATVTPPGSPSSFFLRVRVK